MSGPTLAPRDWMTGLAPSGHITRRSLLLAGAGAAAAAAVPDIAMAAKTKVLRRSHLDRSTWTPLVGTTLWVRDRGVAPVPVTLLRVSDITVQLKQSEKFRERSFVLVFRSAADTPLAMDTHLIKLKGIGKVPVWFSHATLTADGWEYVAVFANGRLRARPVKKPRGKDSRGQAGQRGERRPAKRRKRRRKAASPRSDKPAAPAEPQPAPPAPPAPAPAAPAAPAG
jgi:hypothetical protein